MNRLRLYKWFWGTFGAWCFGVTASAWALIYAPFHFFGSRTISKFSVEINGSTSQNEISSTREATGPYLTELSRKWQEEGWKNITANTNIAGLLLNLPREFHSSIDPLVQIQAFQNSNSFRLLGLWHDIRDGQTYEWTCDLPQKALSPQDPRSVDFPLKPPAEAFDIFNLKLKNISTSIWSIKPTKNPDQVFAHICSLQGFSAKELPKSNAEPTYFLQKGTTQMLGFASQDGAKTTISLMMLSRI